MSTTTINLGLALGPSSSGLPLGTNGAQQILAAARGGDATAAYLASQNTVANFLSWLQANPGGWVQDTKDDGTPYLSATYTDSSHNTITLTIEPPSLSSVQAISNQSQDTGSLTTTPLGSFTYDGITYSIIGHLAHTLSFNQQPLWITLTAVGSTSIVTLLPVLGTAYAQCILPAAVAAKNIVNGLISSLSSSGDAAAVDAGAVAAEAGAEAGAEVAVEGAVVAVGVTVAGVAAMAAVVVFIAVPVILYFIAHKTFHNLRVYNLTSYDIKWSDPYIREGGLSAGPVLADPGSSSLIHFDYSIPAIDTMTPEPGAAPITTAHEADFSMVSSNEFHGIQWVIPFTITDPSNANVLVAAASVLFDLPLDGKNSLYAAFNPALGLSDFYNAYSGKFHNTYFNTTLPLPSGSTALNCSVTYDNLDGKHPSPTGQDGYYYNSIIVFHT